MKILSLDISSHTGWALFSIEDNALSLDQYGILEVIKPQCEYPRQMLLWSANAFHGIIGIIEEHEPDQIIIEETSKGSKNHLSQKFLEFVHFQVASYVVKYKIPVRYFMTGEWRFLIGAKMTKEERERNKKIRQEKTKGNTVVKNDDGKRIGKISKKHVNVRLANEIFGLSLKIGENDKADAILMGQAFFVESKEKEKENERIRQAIDGV